MGKTLFRRAAAGTFAAAVAVGLSTLFATAASAHSAGPTGTADCGDDGRYVITWTVHNDYGTPTKLSHITIKPNGGTHGDISLTAYETKTFTTSYAGSTRGDLRLSVDGLWQDTPTTTWPADGAPRNFTSDPVHLSGDCKVKTPPSSAPPSSPPPSSARPSSAPPRTPTPEASRSAPPTLPKTGSSSTGPLVGTGVALVAGGAGLVFFLRRRNRITFTAE